MLLLLLLPLLWVCEGAESQGGYTLQVQREVTVQEGLCVPVPCQFSYPWSSWSSWAPAHGYWIPGGASSTDAPVAMTNPSREVWEETQSRFLLLGDPRTDDCSLSIRDARKTDTGSYFYRVEREGLKYNYRNHQVSVRVTALTHSPDILIPGTLESGCPSNLICSVPWACEQWTLPTFSWVGTSVSSLGPNITHSSVLTLTPRLQPHMSDSPRNLTVTVSPGAGPGNSGPMAQVVLGATGEVAVKILLLGLWLVLLRVRSCRKRAARPAMRMEHCHVETLSRVSTARPACCLFILTLVIAGPHLPCSMDLPQLWPPVPSTSLQPGPSSSMD